ncbi:hypothetical protein A3F55_00205 [Candidatus Adlerbacteria bacterium RIFCSPHIGHO2_12_FULL_53_18]|uniref:HTH arsR-type domain-containing protein n=1 Tax=Candidatus Adlerbacteria bacterium RIFCSPHIGHO2_12_FULL_53_18 TaxID=1797242 RepID=A0A1F4XS13_9BACT|nr:MAG: hypothetical protein A3F55_00205 [Candidatus Adlerbacteria bacterium RIFCSPHIGHO2_12_FULL_53_18]
MTDTLIKLFGSAARVKLLRLFLFNPQHLISIEEAAIRAQVKPRDARQEISLFLRLGLLERHPRRGMMRYGLAATSPYIEALQNLMINAPARGAEMPARLRSVGALKLIVVAGVFVGEWNGSLDLLVVGDRIKEKTLIKKIKMLEAEIGKEVRYAWMSTPDFFYRLNMSDRLLRDMFDYPHIIVFDRLDIGLK